MEKTKELFDIRNENKKNIEFANSTKQSIRIGELWRYREGINLWNEISKDGKFKRVCLILHNNLGNWLLLVAPITTKYHKWMEKYYIKINNYANYRLKECRIITNQVKLITPKRLFNKTSNNKPLLWLATKVKYAYWEILQK